MQNVLDAINHNAGAINLLFSLVVAGATVFYAVLTHRLVAETKRMREVQTEPTLSIWIEPSEHEVNFINFIIENSGQSPAHAIRLTATPDFERAGGQPLSELGLFRHGIKHLAPRQRITFFLASVFEMGPEGKTDLSSFDFAVAARYKSALGREYTDNFPIHFESYEGFGTIGTPPLISIARDIQKIRNEIEHLASGFRKLQVVVSTRRDVARDEQAIIARHTERKKQARPPDTPAQAEDTTTT